MYVYLVLDLHIRLACENILTKFNYGIYTCVCRLSINCVLSVFVSIQLSDLGSDSVRVAMQQASEGQLSRFKMIL